jgi:hypothetical protein
MSVEDSRPTVRQRRGPTVWQLRGQLNRPVEPLRAWFAVKHEFVADLVLEPGGGGAGGLTPGKFKLEKEPGMEVDVSVVMRGGALRQRCSD